MKIMNAKAKVEKRKLCLADKCFNALFVSLIILALTFIAGMVCMKFNIGIFGGSILTSIIFLKIGIIINFAILGISLLVIAIKN